MKKKKSHFTRRELNELKPVNHPNSHSVNDCPIYNSNRDFFIAGIQPSEQALRKPHGRKFGLKMSVEPRHSWGVCVCVCVCVCVSLSLSLSLSFSLSLSLSLPVSLSLYFSMCLSVCLSVCLSLSLSLSLIYRAQIQY